MALHEAHAMRGTRDPRPTLGAANSSLSSLACWGHRRTRRRGVCRLSHWSVLSLGNYPCTRAEPQTHLSLGEAAVPIFLDGKIRPQLHRQQWCWDEDLGISVSYLVFTADMAFSHLDCGLSLSAGQTPLLLCIPAVSREEPGMWNILIMENCLLTWKRVHTKSQLQNVTCNATPFHFWVYLLVGEKTRRIYIDLTLVIFGC